LRLYPSLLLPGSKLQALSARYLSIKTIKEQKQLLDVTIDEQAA